MFPAPLVVDWHVAFWELLLYSITILSGIIWRGHSCIAPVEHSETRNVIPLKVKYTHIHYLNLVVTAMKSGVSEATGKGLRTDTPPSETPVFVLDFTATTKYATVHPAFL